MNSYLVCKSILIIKLLEIVLKYTTMTQRSQMWIKLQLVYKCELYTIILVQEKTTSYLANTGRLLVHV